MEWSIIVSFVLADSWLVCLPVWVGGLMLTRRASGRKRLVQKSYIITTNSTLVLCYYSIITVNNNMSF